MALQEKEAAIVKLTQEVNDLRQEIESEKQRSFSLSQRKSDEKLRSPSNDFAKENASPSNEEGSGNKLEPTKEPVS